MNLTPTTTAMSSTILSVSLRVQADRVPWVKDNEWEIAIAMVNNEAQELVNVVLGIFLERRHDVTADSQLLKKCVQAPASCGELATNITIVPSLEPLKARLVLGALRQVVYDKMGEYLSLGLKVAWLAPNFSTTLLGWRIEGIASKLSPTDEQLFTTEARSFLANSSVASNHTCDTIVFLSQFMKTLSSLEIHSALLGTSASDNTRYYRKEVLSVFNNMSIPFLPFVDFIESVDSLKTFALTDRAILASRTTPSASPTISFRDSPPRDRLPFTINTIHLGIALAMLAVAIQVCAAVFIIYQKSKLRLQSRTEQDDSLSVTNSEDSR